MQHHKSTVTAPPATVYTENNAWAVFNNNHSVPVDNMAGIHKSNISNTHHHHITISTDEKDDFDKIAGIGRELFATLHRDSSRKSNCV